MREEQNDLLINSTLSKDSMDAALRKAQRDRLGLIKTPSKNESQDVSRSSRWLGGVKQYKTKITFHYRDSKEKERMNADDYYFPKPAIVKVRDLTPE